MPAPCKICGFVSSADNMKQHMSDHNGGDKRYLSVRCSNVQEIVFSSTTQVEADTNNFFGDVTTRVMKYRMGKRSSNVKSGRNGR
jgi:hypothetical protein